MPVTFLTKRIYDSPAKGDGARVLVDRLWPRGMSKQKAALDMWLKDIAPSPELRVWFNHDPEKFSEFSKKYTSELASNPNIQMIKDLVAHHSTITLLYGAKDPTINHAIVLQKFLQRFL